MLVVFAVVGAGLGWLWERWATPPTGVVASDGLQLGFRVSGDYLDPDAAAMGHVFGVVGTYAVLCAGAGLVLGVVAAVLCRRSELVTLVVVAGSSALAAFVCYRVGLALGPDDPAAQVAQARIGTVVTGDLSIDQLSPFVVLPMAALIGLAVTYLLTTGASAGVAGTRRIDLDAPARTPGQPTLPGPTTLA